MTTAYRLYLLFVVSWFLHLTSRVPALGAIRFDLLLVLLIAVLCLDAYSSGRGDGVGEGAGRRLLILITYAALSLPFVEWPGSALRFGFQSFIKGVVFYYFTVTLVDSEARLTLLLKVFLGCQIVRVLEPLYLHVTQGYWGDRAYMDGEWLTRLSGAPHDVIGPNGLAFVILTVLPFLYFFRAQSWRANLAFVTVVPPMLYALLLTGSRSGFLGLVCVVVMVVWKSDRRMLNIAVILLVALGSVPLLSPELRDRYLSIVDSNTRNAATAEGRLKGIESDFAAALHRPFFGHGLGTSRETNANFGTGDQVSHNLYGEVAQELGFIGLALFLAYMVTVTRNFLSSLHTLVGREPHSEFLLAFGRSAQTWLAMNFMFSFASYGLHSYEWYLFGGLSVVLHRLVRDAGVANKHVAKKLLTWSPPREPALR